MLGLCFIRCLSGLLRDFWRGKQIRLAGDPGGESPGAVAARRARLIGGREGEPGPAGQVRPTRRIRFVPFRGGGCRPGAALADGVALAVGDGQAPGGAGVAGRGGGQVAGQVGVDGANPSYFAGLATSGSACSLNYEDSVAVQEAVQPRRRTTTMPGKSSLQVHNGVTTARVLPKADMRC